MSVVVREDGSKYYIVNGVVCMTLKEALEYLDGIR
jgi:protein associated with RNAse G/E